MNHFGIELKKITRKTHLFEGETFDDGEIFDWQEEFGGRCMET